MDAKYLEPTIVCPIAVLSRLSLLIAEYEHVSCGHIGVAATVSRIRFKFWIIKIHKLVSRIVNQCVECRKKRASQSGQIMGV